LEQRLQRWLDIGEEDVMVVGLLVATTPWESNPFLVVGWPRRTSVHVPLIGTSSRGPLLRTWENAPDQGVGDGLSPADQVHGDQLQHSPP
jgi:hypothetical protein